MARNTKPPETPAATANNSGQTSTSISSKSSTGAAQSNQSTVNRLNELMARSQKLEETRDAFLKSGRLSASNQQSGVPTSQPKGVEELPPKKYAKAQKLKSKNINDLEINLIRTYEFRDDPPDGFQAWCYHKFDALLLFTVTPTLIEGNFKSVLQLGWFKPTDDQMKEEDTAAAERSQQQYDEAAVLRVRLGNWEVEIEPVEDTDSDGGIRPRNTKTIHLDNFQKAWAKGNGPTLLKELMKEYFEFPKTKEGEPELIIKYIETGGKRGFSGKVTIDVEKFIKIPVKFIELPMIYKDDDDAGKFKAADWAKIKLAVKCHGIDRRPDSKPIYVKPQTLCNICQSPKHLTKNCPRKREGPKLYRCGDCSQLGTCTWGKCIRINDIREGNFSRVQTDTVTYASNPFKQVPREHQKKRKQPAFKTGYTPKTIDQEYPVLAQKDVPNGSGFYKKNEGTIIGEEEQRAKEAEEKKNQANRPKLSGNRKRKGDNQIPTNGPVKTSNKFTELVDNDGQAVIVLDSQDPYQRAVNGESHISLNPKKVSKEQPELLRDRQADKIENWDEDTQPEELDLVEENSEENFEAVNGPQSEKEEKIVHDQMSGLLNEEDRLRNIDLSEEEVYPTVTETEESSLESQKESGSDNESTTSQKESDSKNESKQSQKEPKPSIETTPSQEEPDRSAENNQKPKKKKKKRNKQKKSSEAPSPRREPKSSK